MSAAKDFGANLTRLREHTGLTRAELASRAALHRTEIGRLERGERLPRLSTALKLAGSLGVSLDRLSEGIDWEADAPDAGGGR